MKNLTCHLLLAGILSAGGLGAAHALETTEPSGDQMVADLRRDLARSDEDGGFAISMGLVALGPAAYPVLTDSLKDANPVVRANAAAALAWVPSQGVPPAVIQALQEASNLDSDLQVRGSAALALQELQTPDEEAQSP